jgi:hypothetical protein
LVDLGEAVLFGNIWATRGFIIEDKTEQYVQQYFSVFFLPWRPFQKAIHDHFPSQAQQRLGPSQISTVSVKNFDLDLALCPLHFTNNFKYLFAHFE